MSSTAGAPDSELSPTTQPDPAQSKLSSGTQGSSFASPRLPPLRSSSDPPSAASMTVSSSPLGSLNAARRVPPPSLSSARAGGLPEDMQAKMKAFHLSRQGAPAAPSLRSGGPPPSLSLSSSGALAGGVPPMPGQMNGGLASPTSTTPGGSLAGGMGGLKLPVNTRPSAQNWTSAPAVPVTNPPKQGLGARRGMKLPGGLPGAVPSPSPPSSGPAGQDGGIKGSVNGTIDENPAGGQAASGTAGGSGSLFNKFSEFVDTKSGTLKFAGKAVIHGRGIDFSSGSSFSISLDEVDTLEELGKGNYGTVYKVRHSRPTMRRPGLGLKGIQPTPSMSHSATSSTSTSPKTAAVGDDGVDEPKRTQVTASPETANPRRNTTGIVMAMKEIRLELDEAKFAAIIMELDILHRCISPFIVDFYGAFFQEGAVYICMEYMDGGSIDKLHGDGIPENVLRKIALSTVMGLKSLKEDHNIIHRDVKPTNILANSRGQVKICDFGVSGNLVASIAKTNIGCQSYMAPERIATGGIASAGANPGGGTYSVQSDVWSLGLSMIECALGRYPYPPETYNNIFSQLSVSSEPAFTRLCRQLTYY